MTENPTVIQIHGIVIDPMRWEVLAEGIPIPLTSDQFRLLHFMASNVGLVFTRQQIIDAVHKPKRPVTERSVDFQMMEIRRKLGNLGTLIQTVRGVGFRFRA